MQCHQRTGAGERQLHVHRALGRLRVWHRSATRQRHQLVRGRTETSLVCCCFIFGKLTDPALRCTALVATRVISTLRMAPTSTRQLDPIKAGPRFAAPLAMTESPARCFPNSDFCWSSLAVRHPHDGLAAASARRVLHRRHRDVAIRPHVRVAANIS